MKYLVDRSFFHDVAGVHHCYAVGGLRNNAEIVSDQQHRKIKVFSQASKQLENLGLNRHVERRSRFVRDKQFWFA